MSSAPHVGGRRPGKLDRGQQVAGHLRQQRAGATRCRPIVAQRPRGDRTPRARTTSASAPAKQAVTVGQKSAGPTAAAERPSAKARLPAPPPVTRCLEPGAQQEPPPHGREEALNSVPLGHPCAESYQLRGGAARLAVSMLELSMIVCRIAGGAAALLVSAGRAAAAPPARSGRSAATRSFGAGRPRAGLRGGPPPDQHRRGAWRWSC